ncbi:hypothetical protein C8R45DRAFT_1162723 [Mycena sanguinolenta]|nr:hypothetical protein C8R45DRAFT_1162723 [Mycena sanguinolenta]
MSILIDDSDPSVQYSSLGGWSTPGNVPEFNATTHTSATPGDTATVGFQGSSISVYGTLAPSSGASRLNFSIDGVDSGFYEAPLVPVAIQNQLFWKSPVFSEAQHTLVVTVDQDSSLPEVNRWNRTFFLDYFIYTTNSTGGQTLLVDNTDTSVTYWPGWKSFNNISNSLESTQHVSTSVGSWAAASFNGTGISLFGTPGQKGFSASIVVDGSKPVISKSQTDGDRIFNTSGLSPGPHTINVTVLEGNLGIDYFLVYDAGSPAPATTPQGQPVPSPSPSGTPQLPLPPPGATHSSKKPPVSAIVGGAVGGLTLLLLILVTVFIMRRRRAALVDQPVFEYPDPLAPASHPWDVKRRSVTSMTTLTNDMDRGRPQTFEKERPPSRYIYYDER